MQDYTALALAQVRELWSNYGNLTEIWSVVVFLSSRSSCSSFPSPLFSSLFFSYFFASGCVSACERMTERLPCER